MRRHKEIITALVFGALSPSVALGQEASEALDEPTTPPAVSAQAIMSAPSAQDDERAATALALAEQQRAEQALYAAERAEQARVERERAERKSRHDSLVFLLSSHEYVPVRADFERLGDDAQMEDALLELTRDHTQRAAVRSRAVRSLALYPSERVIGALERMARVNMSRVKPRERAAAGAMRHRAINALAQAQGAEALPFLERMLGHRDVEVRVAAIYAIGKYTGEPGARLLEAHEGTADAERRALGQFASRQT